MSEYHIRKTQFKDAASLIAALKDVKVGCSDIEVEVHEVPQALLDFRGNRTHYVTASGDVAHIIVRRKYVKGMSNDLGFVRNADGTYEALISEYDSTVGCDDKWMKSLKTSYVTHYSAKLASKQGLKMLGTPTVVNGKTQIKFLDMRG